MNRKYTTPPFRARGEGTSAFGHLSLYVSICYASRVFLLLLFLPKEPPMSTFRLFFFFFFPSCVSSSSSFRGVLLRRVARLLPLPRVDGALHVIVQSRRRRRRIIDSKAKASSSSRRVVVHAAREAEQTRRDENVPDASRPRVERHFSLLFFFERILSGKARVFEMPINGRRKNVSRRNDFEKCSLTNSRHKKNLRASTTYTPLCGLEKRTRYSYYDFGKRNDRAARIAGDGLEVSFASRRLFLRATMIARCCILVRVL